jgi:hypothetical protein
MSEYYSSGAGYGRYEEGGVETSEEHYQGEYYEEGNFSTDDNMPLEAGGYQDEEEEDDGIDYEDPAIASLPRILLMGPRRGGKTSIQVRHSLVSLSRLLERLLAYFIIITLHINICILIYPKSNWRFIFVWVVGIISLFISHNFI